ncbi:10152_t:CDS:10, partial [Cetraspora pellucida]
SKKTCESQIPVLQDLRKKLEEDAINMTKPRRKLAKYTDHVSPLTIHPTPNSLQFSRPPSPAVSLADIPPKQGYLFMKPLGGKSTWTKKYFYLKNGIFWWASVGSGKNRSTVEESERMGVLLCEVKLDPSQDRRFCFEVVCGAKQTSYVLQAETEAELKDWITTFESAKRHAFRSTNDLATSAAAAVSSNKESEDEQNQPITDEEQRNDDTVSKSSEGSQLDALDIKSSNLATSSSGDPKSSSLNVSDIANRKRSSSIPNHSRPQLVPTYSGPSKLSGTNLHYSNTGNLVVPLASQSVVNERNASGASQQNFWGTLQMGFMPAMNLLINTVNSTEGDEEAGDETSGRKRSSSFRSKGGRSRSGSGPVGYGADGSIAEYSQILFLHNVQLHFLFPNSTEREYVLDVYNCAWYRNNVLLKGRVYITQDILYFYSVVMSIVNTFCVSWKDIKSITRETTHTLQTIEFSNENGNQKYVLKTFMESSNELYDKAHLIWKLATSEKPSTLQAMYDAVWKDHIPLRSKESREALSDKDAEFHKEDFSINIETPPEKDVRDSIGHSDNQKASDAFEMKDDQTKSDSDKLATKAPHPVPIASKPQEDDDWPSHITQPSEPVECKCTDHLEQLEIEVEYQISAKKLFDMLFDEKSAIWERLHQKKGNTLLHSGPWVIDNSEGGERKRELKFIMPVNNPLLANVKETDCLQTQICQKREDYLCYVVSIQTKALKLPYSDSFLPICKCCITYVSKTSCKLACHIGIKWFKSPMVKKMIRKAAMAGLSETVSDIVELLNTDVQNENVSTALPSSPIRTTHGGYTSTLRRRPHHRAPKSRHMKHTTSDDNSVPGGSSGKMTENISTSLNNGREKIFTIISSVVEILSSLSLNEVFLTESVYFHVSYKQFLDTRIQYPPYPWLLHSHRRLSEEIIHSRKKVAMLRYDLLLTFRLINLIDKRLLESEYINWLLDERAKCNKARWLFMKDDLVYENEDNLENDGCNNCDNSSTINEQTNYNRANTTKVSSNERYKSEYKTILKYCGGIKKQLDVMPTAL